MRGLVLGVILLLLAPAAGGSGDYTLLSVDAYSIWERHPGGVHVRFRPPIVGRIYELSRSFGRDHELSLRWAEAISSKPHPRLLGGICAEEGAFNPNARITYGGCRGAFQVNPHHWGPVPKDPEGQVDQASDVLEGMLRSNKGRVTVTLRTYNGDPSSPATADYPRRVLCYVARLR